LSPLVVGILGQERAVESLLQFGVADWQRPGYNIFAYGAMREQGRFLSYVLIIFKSEAVNRPFSGQTIMGVIFNNFRKVIDQKQFEFAPGLASDIREENSVH